MTKDILNLIEVYKNSLNDKIQLKTQGQYIGKKF